MPVPARVQPILTELFSLTHMNRSGRLISLPVGDKVFLHVRYIKVKVIGKTEIFYFDLRCDPAFNFTTDVATKKKVFIRKG
jgi:hypothetical protein